MESVTKFWQVLNNQNIHLFKSLQRIIFVENQFSKVILSEAFQFLWNCKVLSVLLKTTCGCPFSTWNINDKAHQEAAQRKSQNCLVMKELTADRTINPYLEDCRLIFLTKYSSSRFPCPLPVITWANANF